MTVHPDHQHDQHDQSPFPVRPTPGTDTSSVATLVRELDVLIRARYPLIVRRVPTR
jgi:hypothetical protein